MPLLRGGFRLFKAVTSVIGWPARVKMAPFSVPETAQIPAFWEKDCNTSTGPRWRADEITSPMKAEWLRLRLRASFADPDNFPLAQSGTYLLEHNVSIPVYCMTCEISLSVKRF